jgi:hypothetical protein
MNQPLSSRPNGDRRNNEPVAFYEGPRLQAFQGWRLVALIAASVAIGVGLHAAARVLWAQQTGQVSVTVSHRPAAAPSASTVVPNAHIAWPMTLPGPGGTSVTLSGTAIVNVWLQGCADCMPAFEAMKVLQAGGGFDGARVYNVAYGSADPAWAAKYGVDGNLAFDEGKNIVQPLGIGTFTTLVVDEQGGVRSQGSPVAADFQSRVLSVWREMQPRAVNVSVEDTLRIRETLGFLRGRADELRGCGVLQPGPASVSVTALPKGTLRAEATSPSASASARCVALVVTGWQLESVAPAAVVMDLELVFGISSAAVVGSGAGD